MVFHLVRACRGTGARAQATRSGATRRSVWHVPRDGNAIASRGASFVSGVDDIIMKAGSASGRVHAHCAPSACRGRWSSSSRLAPRGAAVAAWRRAEQHTAAGVFECRWMAKSGGRSHGHALYSMRGCVGKNPIECQVAQNRPNRSCHCIGRTSCKSIAPPSAPSVTYRRLRSVTNPDIDCVE